MDVTPLIPKGHQLIESYGGGGFCVTQVQHQGSVLVFQDRTEAWAPNALEDVTQADLVPVLACDPLPEMVLVGCGKEFCLLPKTLKAVFREKGVPVEAMDTGAACRTYNILLAEGRRVVAALIAV